MKIFDKIKDLFTDEIIEEKEEIIEIKEEKKVNEERKLPTVLREEQEKDKIDNNISDIDLFKDFENIELDNVNNNVNTRSNFRFPISFEENELLDEKILSNQNVLHRQKEQEIIKKPSTELYSKKTTPEEKVTFFKVSPVISPVYGILDKNYKKDEVLSKTKKPNEIKRTSKNVDFESVRKKAYGSLIDDIKDNLSPVKIEEKKEDKKIEGIYELNEDISQITLGEIESNFEDFGISFEDYNKKEEKDDNIKIVSFDEKETVAEKIEINDSVIKSNKQEDDFEETKEEDIFNLIDSMMKKEEEENND